MESSTVCQNGILVIMSTARGGTKGGYEFLFPHTPRTTIQRICTPFFGTLYPFGITRKIISPHSVRKYDKDYWKWSERTGPKGQSVLPKITIVLRTFVRNAEKLFFLWFQRVRSSKKRGTNSLSRGPGGVRGHEKRNSYPTLCTPPCSRRYHQNSHFGKQY